MKWSCVLDINVPPSCSDYIILPVTGIQMINHCTHQGHHSIKVSCTHLKNQNFLWLNSEKCKIMVFNPKEKITISLPIEKGWCLNPEIRPEISNYLNFDKTITKSVYYCLKNTAKSKGRLPEADTHYISKGFRSPAIPHRWIWGTSHS